MNQFEVNMAVSEIIAIEAQLDRLRMIKEALKTALEKEMVKRGETEIDTPEGTVVLVGNIEFDSIDTYKVRDYFLKHPSNEMSAMQAEVTTVGIVPGGIIVKKRG